MQTAMNTMKTELFELIKRLSFKKGNFNPWMRIVLVEDVVTTGGSTLKAIEAIQSAYPSVQILGVLAIIDRNAGGKEAFSRLGIPFQALFDIQAFLTE